MQRPGGAARVAAHLLAAGAPAQREAVEYSLQAARDATARLGHADACGHYLRALQLIDEHDDPARSAVLIELAGAHARAGMSDLALQRFREVAVIGRHTGNAVKRRLLPRWGCSRSGTGPAPRTPNCSICSTTPPTCSRPANGPLTLRSRVLASSARTVRHGSQPLPGAELADTARRAVELAAAAGDAGACSPTAKLAVHDVMWAPGTARRATAGDRRNARRRQGERRRRSRSRSPPPQGQCPDRAR